jgi:DNA polymerase III alpha subunit
MLAKTVSHRTDELGDGMKVTVGGLVTKLKAMKIKSGVNEGRMMGRFVLEDLHGAIPVTLFANQYEQFGYLLQDEAVVTVRGEVRERGSELEMSVDEMESLDAIAAKALARVEVRVSHDLGEPTLRALSEVLLEHHGRTPVAFRVRYPNRTVTITPSEAYTVSHDDRLTSRVEEILGQGVVTLRYDGVA